MFRLGLDLSRNAVRAEYDRGAVRDFGQFLDEDRADFAQAIHDVLVVNHFVAHVDRRPEQPDRPFNDVDRPVDSGAEAARICQ